MNSQVLIVEVLKNDLFTKYFVILDRNIKLFDLYAIVGSNNFPKFLFTGKRKKKLKIGNVV